MVLDLNSEQRGELELISLHAGKSPAQLLTEAARYLLDRDLEFWQSLQPGPSAANCQTFLPEEDLNARFAQLLRR
jgi:hypothetical protein